MKRFLLIVLTVLAVVMVHSPALTLDAVFPKDIQIVPPGPDISLDIARLSGKWEGEWETPGSPSRRGLNYKLAIQELSNNQAILTYCWGDDERPSSLTGCKREVQGDISLKEGLVALEHDSPKYSAKIKFLLILGDDRKSDILKGYGAVSYIKMKRMTK
jgi:hypothetical protein